LNEHSALVDEQELGAIESLAGRLDAARGGSDRELIAKLVDELNEATTPFAHRIMDEAIKAALEKRSVEEVSNDGS
jgi:hypothetical protein